MRQNRILIADDNDLFLDTLLKWLKLEPWTAEVAKDGQGALDLLCSHHFNIAVLDVYMPCLSGLEVLQAVRRKGIQTDVIILTGEGCTDLAVEAIKMGARDYVEKQSGLPKLIAAIRALFESHRPPHVLADRLDAFLKDNASNPLLKLTDLGRHFKYTPRYIAMLFEKHLNTSFRKRLSFHRVQKAKQLLESVDDPLYVIAAQCGFKNYRRLAEAFHRLEEISPLKYRKICSDKRINFR